MSSCYATTSSLVFLYDENPTNQKGPIDNLVRFESIARLGWWGFKKRSRSINWPGGHRLPLFSEILPCGVRESEFEERVPSGDLLFHVPYLQRRN